MTLPTVDPYLDLIDELPLPTQAQTEAFVDYVAGSHSWYKHLPPLPPGARFAFFLNPNVARDQVRTPSGEIAFVDRTEDDETRFHYTWMTTAEYRARYGYWDYHCASAPQFMLLGGGTVTALRCQIRVLDGRGDWIRPSPGVVEAGECEVTGLVHERLNPMVWGRRQADSLAAYHALPDSHLDAERYRPWVKDIAYFVNREAAHRPPERGALERLVASFGQRKAAPGPTRAAWERLEAFHRSERKRLRERMFVAMEQVLAVLARER